MERRVVAGESKTSKSKTSPTKSDRMCLKVKKSDCDDDPRLDDDDDKMLKKKRSDDTCRRWCCRFLCQLFCCLFLLGSAITMGIAYGTQKFEVQGDNDDGKKPSAADMAKTSLHIAKKGYSIAKDTANQGYNTAVRSIDIAKKGYDIAMKQYDSESWAGETGIVEDINEWSSPKSTSSTASKSNPQENERPVLPKVLCPELCKRKRKRDGQISGNLLDGNDLMHIVHTERERLISKLKKDYGSANFNNIFGDGSAAPTKKKEGGNNVNNSGGSAASGSTSGRGNSNGNYDGSTYTSGGSGNSGNSGNSGSVPANNGYQTGNVPLVKMNNLIGDPLPARNTNNNPVNADSATTVRTPVGGFTQTSSTQTNSAPMGGTQTSVKQTYGTQTSGTQADGTQTSGTQAYGKQTSGTQAYGTQTSGTQAYGTQTSGTQTGGTQTFGTQTGGTQPFGKQTGGTQTFGTQTGGSQTYGTQTGGTGPNTGGRERRKLQYEQPIQQQLKSKSLFRPTGHSWERMKRKLILKLLSVQKTIIQEDYDLHQCNCEAIEQEEKDNMFPDDAQFEGTSNAGGNGPPNDFGSAASPNNNFNAPPMNNYGPPLNNNFNVPPNNNFGPQMNNYGPPLNNNFNVPPNNNFNAPLNNNYNNGGNYNSNNGGNYNNNNGGFNNNPPNFNSGYGNSNNGGYNGNPPGFNNNAGMNPNTGYNNNNNYGGALNNVPGFNNGGTSYNNGYNNRGGNVRGRRLQQQTENNYNDNQQEQNQQQQQHPFQFQEYNDNDSDEDDLFYSKFVFASGGHSVAAGLGNFFDEGYTNVLEKTVKNVFKSVGINFVGRQYGMGAAESGGEIGLCVDSLFGVDIDVLNWNFGLTDGNKLWKLLLYAYKTGIQNPHITTPIYHDHIVSSTALMTSFMEKQGRAHKVRSEMVKDLGHSGMMAFYQDQDVWNEMLKQIPDTVGLSEGEVSNMPKFIKEFKCDGKFETDGCRMSKYNVTMCEKRKFQAPWHPGWKMHALKGNVLSLFFVELLADAVQEISSLGLNTVNDRHKLFNELRQKEKMEYERFMQADIPVSRSLGFFKGQSETGDIDINTIFKSRGFCHTARLPADIRYRGILTQSNSVGRNNYEKGVPESYAQTSKMMKDRGYVRLVYDENTRQKGCSAVLQKDYNDFFYIQDGEGWTTAYLPNHAERQYYFHPNGNNLNNERIKGIILMCITPCVSSSPDGCPIKDSVSEDDLKANSGAIEMKINGQPVMSYSSMGDCLALKNNYNGHRWEPLRPNDVTYEIKIRVNKPNSHLRLSSLILI